MTLDDFRHSLTAAKPPAELALALAGLWWDLGLSDVRARGWFPIVFALDEPVNKCRARGLAGFGWRDEAHSRIDDIGD